jgi:hypothetical protein
MKLTLLHLEYESGNCYNPYLMYFNNIYEILKYIEDYLDIEMYELDGLVANDRLEEIEDVYHIFEMGKKEPIYSLGNGDDWESFQDFCINYSKTNESMELKHLLPFKIKKNMRIKRFNDSKSEALSEVTLKDMFRQSVDLCVEFGIRDAFFDPEDMEQYFNNSFHKKHEKNEYRGFELSFEHNFYGDANPVIEFTKYVELINEINNDLKRLMELYDLHVIFTENSNSQITLVILEKSNM